MLGTITAIGRHEALDGYGKGRMDFPVFHVTAWIQHNDDEALYLGHKTYPRKALDSMTETELVEQAMMDICSSACEGVSITVGNSVEQEKIPNGIRACYPFSVSTNQGAIDFILDSQTNEIFITWTTRGAVA